MRSPSRTFTFGDLPRTVRFTECDELIEAIRAILLGWEIREVPAAAHPPPVIRLKRTPGGYRRVSAWRCTPSLAREKVRKTVVGALCGFHFEFIDWYVEEHPEQLCLHGAAARFDDRLVVFPSTQRAGKSVLSVYLASAGVQVWCDDVLPIEIASGEGVGLGIQLRLRPPLPRDATRAFRDYVESRRGPGFGNRLYLRCREGELAALGERAPIGGLVLLERGARRKATLEAVDAAEMLEEIILQNFAREVPSPDILDTLHRIVSEARCLRLRYARAPDAVALLQRAFGPDAASRSVPPDSS